MICTKLIVKIFVTIHVILIIVSFFLIFSPGNKGLEKTKKILIDSEEVLKDIGASKENTDKLTIKREMDLQNDR
jgi:hypothetical protein